MSTFLIILSCLLWLLSLWMLAGRPVLGPALSYLAMLTLSFATGDYGLPLLPINNTMLIGWLCMTLVVMVATYLQPAVVVSQTRGMGYMIGGALVGMVIGLLAFTFTTSLALLYASMIVATAVGIFFGFLLYSRTPDGAPLRLGSRHFFEYLLAKGFPTAITVMQLGMVLVLVIAMANAY